MRETSRQGGLGDDQAVDPVAVIGGQGVGDRHADVGPVQGEPLVAKRVHQRRPGRWPGWRCRTRPGACPDSPIPRWSTATTEKSRASVGISMRQAYQVWGQPCTSSSGGPVAAGDRVQAQLTGVDVPAGERAGEPGREVRRPGY